ncbi:hypothetical protein [Roseobacter sp. HKCCA0434]|uniref:hypothetical protein n=1 Tax=Roseobacter sp. HKCCA0434 TaxID=3079297 RepID=UPI002905CFE2|nr:hypothetical protein [Roseobacter sp. HKCCA0434]
MKRIVAGAGLLGVLAACEPQPDVAAIPASQLNRDGCYTVDLYDDPYRRNEIQPAKQGLPRDWNRYLGTWGNGAWNGGQCHEIHVTEVYQDGSVVVIDTTAPFRDLRAESHRRAARIDRQGRLVVPSTVGATVYVFNDRGQLRGTRFRNDGDVDQVILTAQSAG